MARGDTQRADALMRDAIAALVQWQSRADASGLPPYDDALLRRELALFPDWCVAREFGVDWSADAAAAVAGRLRPARRQRAGAADAWRCTATTCRAT